MYDAAPNKMFMLNLNRQSLQAVHKHISIDFTTRLHRQRIEHHK